MSRKEERLNQVVDILKKRNSATIKELAVLLDVSEMTIRRDMEMLKAKGIILDIPGVAVLNASAADEADKYLLSMATTFHAKEKERIGRYAATLIHDDDCIVIDNGSTTECLADNIGPDKKISVFTCNLNIVNKVCNHPNVSIIFGGGYYHPDTTLFECEESIALLKKVRATKAFLSAAGVHESMGITGMNSYELTIKRELIQTGAEKILLVDSSKFGLIKPWFITDLEIFDRIITDTDITQEWVEIIEKKDIMLDIV
ncbi:MULTISPECIES: DeoR/GlpR family DNA-binding transcription regulator [Lachnospiraceae]|uniref:DeoR/GlpR family DNA-binding transcription regulator n=1 Tax=Faecalicatena acetigenes TaxID=2981790 RepID=A0ABT2T765_9FIRM|nr:MULTISPECIES: DeoR/GlpR family DNA-binding transcription regulator [Lachnospiraceae]MCU6746075.1 DeoR/GlpR family DNA-binding transcription regulator [Faecalicatena acetigenes]RGT72975.1 DeoR/GlpR transcriptional regulator [Ruminococcus sp. AF18-22]SCG93512.1 Deoxyribose operon repressor [uncultured Clostridium sp.]